MPAARLATRTASGRSLPAASIAASAAITVSPAREADHARDMSKPALAIVRQDHCIAAGDELRVIGELGTQDLMTRFGFEIDSQKLVLARADHAQLDRGIDRAVMVQAGRDIFFSQQRMQPASRVITTHPRQQGHTPPPPGGGGGNGSRAAPGPVAAPPFSG